MFKKHDPGTNLDKTGQWWFNGHVWILGIGESCWARCDLGSDYSRWWKIECAVINYTHGHPEDPRRTVSIGHNYEDHMANPKEVFPSVEEAKAFCERIVVLYQKGAQNYYGSGVRSAAESRKCHLLFHENQWWRWRKEGYGYANATGNYLWLPQEYGDGTLFLCDDEKPVMNRVDSYGSVIDAYPLAYTDAYSEYVVWIKKFPDPIGVSDADMEKAMHEFCKERRETFLRSCKDRMGILFETEESSFVYLCRRNLLGYTGRATRIEVRVEGNKGAYAIPKEVVEEHFSLSY